MIIYIVCYVTSTSCIISSFHVPGRFLYTTAFKVPHKKNSNGVKSGNLTGQATIPFPFKTSAKDNYYLKSYKLVGGNEHDIYLIETGEAVLQSLSNLLEE